MLKALFPEEHNCPDCVKVFMALADADGDKMVNYEEIVRIIFNEPDKKTIARAMFRIYDVDASGKLSKKELIEV